MQLHFRLHLHLFSYPALIAGIMVSLLVVVLLLMVGVLGVVVMMRRMRKMKEIGQSHSKAEFSPHKDDVNAIYVYVYMYPNVQSRITPASGPYYSTSTAADAFINPASATAFFKTHMHI